MAQGDFEAAWAISDAVLAGRDSAARDDPGLPYHRRFVWDGRPFDGRRVLVRCYHGLGDTIQFCRFLPPLRRRVAHLTLEAQPELLALLAHVPGPDRLLPFRPNRPSPPSACDLEIMELCHALRQRPDPAAYLPIAGPASGRFRVGLCWHIGSAWQPERGIAPELLAPLLGVPGIEFVSLQRGAAPLPGVADDCPASILDTAQRIAGLDLVISVDTMVAHLAGALGASVLLLLPANPDWRWQAGGRGSVWYRGVRKYVQPRPGDWAAPLDAVVGDLKRARAGTLRAQRGS